jgi:hypothetical protein
MAYQSVENDHVESLQPAHLEFIELDTPYDPGSDRYEPLPEQSLDSDSKFEDDDKKPLFRTTLRATLSSDSDRSAQPQRAVTMTLKRAALMVFDGLLASTPVMFIGKLKPSLLCFFASAS